MTKTQGGQTLRKATATDIINSIEEIRGGYRTLPHAELIALCARLDIHFTLYELIFNAPKNVDYYLSELKELSSDIEDEADQ